MSKVNVSMLLSYEYDCVGAFLLYISFLDCEGICLQQFIYKLTKIVIHLKQFVYNSSPKHLELCND